MATVVMVELVRGCGDGFGVVEVDDSGRPLVVPGRDERWYTDHGEPTEWKIPDWQRQIMARPTVVLQDKGVQVFPGAIVRVIGPTDCPEACRVRANRFCSNFPDPRAAERPIKAASDTEIVAAMSHETCADTLAAMDDLIGRAGEPVDGVRNWV